MPVCDLPKYKSELNFLSKLTLSKEIKKYGQGEVTNISWRLLKSWNYPIGQIFCQKNKVWFFFDFEENKIWTQQTIFMFFEKKYGHNTKAQETWPLNSLTSKVSLHKKSSCISRTFLLITFSIFETLYCPQKCKLVTFFKVIILSGHFTQAFMLKKRLKLLYLILILP